MNVMTRQLLDFSTVEWLYETKLRVDFPPDELKPLESVRRSWLKDEYCVYGLFEGDVIRGYAFFVRDGSNYLLDYFAIDRGWRNMGLGSVFLGQLAQVLKGADCVVCEVENPDLAESQEVREVRECRMRFYLRNGFLRTAVTSVLFGVHYRILEISGKRSHSAQEICSIYSQLYRITLPDVFFRTRFRAEISGSV